MRQVLSPAEYAVAAKQPFTMGGAAPDDRARYPRLSPTRCLLAGGRVCQVAAERAPPPSF